VSPLAAPHADLESHSATVPRLYPSSWRLSRPLLMLRNTGRLRGDSLAMTSSSQILNDVEHRGTRWERDVVPLVVPTGELVMRGLLAGRPTIAAVMSTEQTSSTATPTATYRITPFVSHTAHTDLTKVAFPAVTHGWPSLSWHECFDRLQEFSTLPPGWDSYDADSISEQAISLGRELLLDFIYFSDRIPERLLLPSNVVPLADGGVQFEWFRNQRHLEAEITTDGEIACLLVIDGLASRHSFQSIDVGVHDVVGLVALASGEPVRWSTNR